MRMKEGYRIFHANQIFPGLQRKASPVLFELARTVALPSAGNDLK